MKVNFVQEECFMPIPIKSVNRKKILEYAKNSTDFAQTGYLPQFAFLQKKLPQEFVLEDPFLSTIHNELDIPMSGFAINKMEPNCFYSFHIDMGRPVSINMCLSEGTDNKTYFKASKQHDLLFNIIPLEYELDTYYLLNTQAYHGALSGANNRYLLSVTLDYAKVIKDDPMTIFNKYCNWIKEKYN